MLEGESVSVGCETPSLLLAFVPLLQEARPPMMTALATSERTTLEFEWERRVEQNMAAPGTAQLGGRAALRRLPQEQCPANLHTGPMLTLEQFSGGEI
jgi:hypothetical protein